MNIYCKAFVFSLAVTPTTDYLHKQETRDHKPPAKKQSVNYALLNDHVVPLFEMFVLAFGWNSSQVFLPCL